MELDQFMKELSVAFLEDVVAIFFPHLARRLNFSQQRDLNKQFYTDSPRGVERSVDVLIEVALSEPPPQVVLIHIESQQQRRFDFSARMLGYHCLVYTREIESERNDTFTFAEFGAWQRRKQLLSLVFCNYPLDDGISTAGYQLGSAETHLNCQYTCISLPLLSASEYLQKEKAVVCALAVLMNSADLSSAQLKVGCYRKLLSFLPTLTDRQVDLIVYAVETYLILSEEEVRIYRRLIEEVYPEVNEMITNPLREQGRQQGIEQGVQQGIEQGMQQGIEQGRHQGMQQSILRVLSRRFSPLPLEIRQRVVALDETEKLERLLDAALEVDSLDTLTTNGLLPPASEQ